MPPLKPRQIPASFVEDNDPVAEAISAQTDALVKLANVLARPAPVATPKADTSAAVAINALRESLSVRKSFRIENIKRDSDGLMESADIFAIEDRS